MSVFLNITAVLYLIIVLDYDTYFSGLTTTTFQDLQRLKMKIFDKVVGKKEFGQNLLNRSKYLQRKNLRQ